MPQRQLGVAMYVYMHMYMYLSPPSLVLGCFVLRHVRRWFSRLQPSPLCFHFFFKKKKGRGGVQLGRMVVLFESSNPVECTLEGNSTLDHLWRAGCRAQMTVLFCSSSFFLSLFVSGIFLLDLHSQTTLLDELCGLSVIFFLFID